LVGRALAKDVFEEKGVIERTIQQEHLLKDIFSTLAELYSKYRPVYPPELFNFILSFVSRREAALDCATGNRQVARTLAPQFRRVCAVDISENQLSHAVKLDNIEYSVCRAEQTPFSNNSFDLITVAQAYHWFDGSQFCREANRVARSGAIVAIWVYDLAYSTSQIDRIVQLGRGDRQYHEDVGKRESKEIYLPSLPEARKSSQIDLDSS
jgi:ubiquinone/menaquinone biosynthesis C-methylase UbiE